MTSIIGLSSQAMGAIYEYCSLRDLAHVICVHPSLKRGLGDIRIYNAILRELVNKKVVDGLMAQFSTLAALSCAMPSVSPQEGYSLAKCLQPTLLRLILTDMTPFNTSGDRSGGFFRAADDPSHFVLSEVCPSLQALTVLGQSLTSLVLTQAPRTLTQLSIPKAILNPTDLALLPPNLTDLDAPFIVSNVTEYHLPLTLTTLKTAMALSQNSGGSDACDIHMPGLSLLQTFIFTELPLTNASVAALPRSLTKLKITFLDDTLHHSLTQHTLLESLSIRPYEILSDNAIGFIGLPKSLKMLSCPAWPGGNLFSDLPPSITHLVAKTSGWDSFTELNPNQVAHLPKNLKICELSPFSVQPPVSLSRQVISHSIEAILPTSLTDLTLARLSGQISFDFSSATSLLHFLLESLNNQQYGPLMRSLPTSLTDLSLTADSDIVWDEKLPPNVSQFSLSTSSNSFPYDSRDAVPYLDPSVLPTELRILLLNGFCLKINDFGRLPHHLLQLSFQLPDGFEEVPSLVADQIGLLPRSLTTLDIGTNHSPSFDPLLVFPHLPPNLSELQLYGLRILLHDDMLHLLPRSLLNIYASTQNCSVQGIQQYAPPASREALLI